MHAPEANPVLMLAAAILVGSQACRPCHPAIADAYAQTPMARSSGPAPALPTAGFTAAGHRYKISGNTLAFDQAGTAPIDYFVGSNSEGRTYLQSSDGHLFELPVTWYARRAAYDASPGYQNNPDVQLNRAVEPSCLLCHASQVRPVLGTQNRYGDPPFLEGGVSCERCHGPGSEHVRNPASSRMVQPAQLPPDRRDSVCAQCHLTGEARIENAGRRLAEFQAGDRLADFATYFVWKLGRTDLKVTSHVEKLAASRCKAASGDKLWCGTCHGVHGNSSRTQQACLDCHQTAHRQQEQCADCHMPKTRAVDANHGVMTDHSIPRTPRTPLPPVAGDLVAFLGQADSRSLGIAYAEMGDPRARDLLRQARPADWQLRLRLAVLETDPARAAALYESVLKERPGETAALVNLGAFYGAAGQSARAIELWRRALDSNPGNEEATLNLVKLLPRAEAKAVLTRYLSINPGSRSARSAVANF